MPSVASAKTASGRKPNSLRLIAAAATLFLILLTVMFHQSNHQQSQCGPYRRDTSVKIGTQNIDAEVASSSQAQQKGLSGRPCIGSNQAMLFTFSQPGHYSFWMKDMKFPIDIVWIGADHKVVTVEREVKPSTYPNSFINKDKPAKYVLELRAGNAKNLGIDTGSLVSF